VRQVLDQVKGDKRTKRYKSIETILQNVTWDLLDHLVIANTEKIPDQVKSSLQELLSDMKTKRIDVQNIASGWESEPLQALLSAPVVADYIQFIKGI
jgi:predicted oxidoreductase